MDTYCKSVNFVFVYIEEAHAVDEWPMPLINESVSQHKTIQERLNAAKKLVNSFEFHPEIHIVLDTINNDYNRTYSSWPFRYYVIVNNMVELKAMPVDDTMTLESLVDWLQRTFQWGECR